MLGDGDVNGGDGRRKSANAARPDADEKRRRGAARRSCAGADGAARPDADGALSAQPRGAAPARFGGVQLSLEGDPELCARWQHATGVDAVMDGPGTRLRCRLHPLGPGAAPLADGLGWAWSEPCGRVWAPRGEASVRRDGGGYAADVWVGDDTRATRLLLVGLASLALQLEGGLILHAASVMLEAGVFAFIGPSGAGKSTACQQVRDGAPFSVDRLALLPSATPGAGWLAHSLPGGSPAAYELGAQARWRPLRALLRVQATALGSRLERCPPALAVLLARESTFQLGRGAPAEHALLGALERLAREVGVGRAHVQLGADLTPLLRAWPLASDCPEPT